jgi:hypothetical protein
MYGTLTFYFVHFTQNLTPQQRNDADSFKDNMQLAAHLRNNVDLMYFPVVQLRVDSCYAAKPQKAAPLLSSEK